MSAPVFVTTKVAVPALDVHTPVAVKAGGGGGGGGGRIQRDMSATVVKPASFGLENV